MARIAVGMARLAQDMSGPAALCRGEQRTAKIARDRLTGSEFEGEILGLTDVPAIRQWISGPGLGDGPAPTDAGYLAWGLPSFRYAAGVRGEGLVCEGRFGV